MTICSRYKVHLSLQYTRS